MGDNSALGGRRLALSKDLLLAKAVGLCITSHSVAWLAAATVWAFKWAREGPAPAGPLYYSAQTFIANVDILVYDFVHRLTMAIAPMMSSWLAVSIGACLTLVFAVLILAAGTVQWLLLGTLAAWVGARKGRTLGLVLLGFYAVWIAGSLFLWVAS